MANSNGRQSWWGRHQQAIAIVFAASGLLLLCGFPLLSHGQLASNTLSIVLSEALPWPLFGHTVSTALIITLTSVTLGVPLGVLLGRFNIVGGSVALWLHALPLFLPPFLLSLGWFAVWGKQGHWGGPWTSSLLFSRFGLTVTLALALTPLVSLLTVWSLRNLDPSLLQAARISRSPLAVTLAIDLPLAGNSIFLASLCVFGLSMCETAVPVFLRVPSYSIALASQLGASRYNPHGAMLLALPLLGLALALSVAGRLFANIRSQAKGVPSPPLSLGKLRLPLSGGVWLIIAGSLLPLLGLAYDTTGSALIEAMNNSASSFITSLAAASAAAVLIVVLGGIIGHASARDCRSGFWLVPVIDRLVLVSFFTPGSLVAVGLIGVWNRPSLLWIYDSVGMISIGLGCHYALLGVRLAQAIVQSSSVLLEEAAACAGAHYWSRWWTIVLPLHRRQWGGAFLLVLLFGLRDLDIAIGLYPPGIQPLTARLFSLEANSGVPAIAALALLQVALSAILLLASALLLRPPHSDSSAV